MSGEAIWIGGAIVIGCAVAAFSGFCPDRCDPEEVPFFLAASLVWPLWLVLAACAIPFVAAYHLGRWIRNGTAIREAATRFEVHAVIDRDGVIWQSLHPRERENVGRTAAEYDEQWPEWAPFRVVHLVARGYDLSTLRFTVRKKGAR